MQYARLDESQAGIKIAGRNIKNLRYADDTTLVAEHKGVLKNLLMKVKEESGKAGLKLNIKKKKKLRLWHPASSLITSWQIEEGTLEAETDFIFFSCKITADGDCSHEIKGCLLLGRSSDKPRQHIEKQRHHFANKGLSSQSYGFSSSHVWV